MQKRKYKMQGTVFWCVLCLLSAALTVCGGRLPAAAGTGMGTEVPYQVFFVDEEDENTSIFYPQEGTVPEGTILQVSFPEQIVGSDGHIWNSLAESPQEFPVYQYGVHKYFISYQQGKKVKTEAPKEEEVRLKEWISTAWRADCEITGQNPESMPNPHLIGESQQDQEKRIRQLVSQIADSERHTFYLIGKNHIPQTVSLGTGFDVVYSAVSKERIFLGADWYQVMEIRVKRVFRPETCEHCWELISQEEASDGKNGEETWQCSLCRQSEQVKLAPLGSSDSEQGELLYWKKGDVQLRKLGARSYRFVCVDEDYRSSQDQHRTAALFLCETVIRSDVNSDSTKREVLSFGSNNNYKTSFVRSWLKEQGQESQAQLDPISIGVCSAYTGSTQKGSGAQWKEGELCCYSIPYQWMTDSIFLLSVEEAVRYREELWKVQGQRSAYAQGYYLRTPYYEETESGSYQDGEWIYVVDLNTGNIHPAKTDSETYGLRPAFVLPQGE